MDEVVGRKAPNTGTTTEAWAAIFERFKAGERISALAREYDLSFSAVSTRLQTAGVTRADHPRPRRKATVVAAAPPPLAGAEPPPAGAALVLPEGADARATARALADYSRALTRQGELREAADALRLARLHRLTEDGVAAANDDRAPLPAPPVLRGAQTPPEGDWRTWLFLGGRGAGKTLAGAAWLAGRARAPGARLALVGPTLLDVRDVMIEGPSGLRGLGGAFGPAGGLPTYEPSKRKLSWPNGAVGKVFSAEDPDALRGPQFEAAWADEVCAWTRPETLAQLRMGLRLGDDPRLALTTTPRPTAALRALLAEAGLAVTRGSAVENAAWLAPGYVERLRALYGGTRLEGQEIDGEVLEALEGAVFRRAEIARARGLGAGARPAAFERLVVAVDPPAGLDGAACGIVTAGRAGSCAWVLEDRTIAGFSPSGWASRVAEAAEAAARLGPVSIVAEANQGGEMVRSVLTQAGVGRPVKLVHAGVGKRARAEPVALLYEQGRVAHAAGLEALEDQMLLLGAAGERGAASPDRADAAVWALTELMLGKVRLGPRITVL